MKEMNFGTFFLQVCSILQEQHGWKDANKNIANNQAFLVKIYEGFQRGIDEVVSSDTLHIDWNAHVVDVVFRIKQAS